MAIYLVFYVRRSEVKTDHKPPATAVDFVRCGNVAATNAAAARRSARQQYPYLRHNIAVQREEAFRAYS